MDTVMLVVKATFDFDLYIIDPGEEVFISPFVWPNRPQSILSYPAVKRLRRTLSYSTIQLTKQSYAEKSVSCNDTRGYSYGGKIETRMFPV